MARSAQGWGHAVPEGHLEKLKLGRHCCGQGGRQPPGPLPADPAPHSSPTHLVGLEVIVQGELQLPQVLRLLLLLPLTLPLRQARLGVVIVLGGWGRRERQGMRGGTIRAPALPARATRTRSAVRAYHRWEGKEEDSGERPCSSDPPRGGPQHTCAHTHSHVPARAHVCSHTPIHALEATAPWLTTRNRPLLPPSMPVPRAGTFSQRTLGKAGPLRAEGRDLRARGWAPYLAPSHVPHAHSALGALALLLLVLPLLAAALLADAEAAGEEQEADDHHDGDESPGRHCPRETASGCRPQPPEAWARPRPHPRAPITQDWLACRPHPGGPSPLHGPGGCSLHPGLCWDPCRVGGALSALAEGQKASSLSTCRLWGWA